MKRICILLEEQWHTAILPDAAAAVHAFRGYGFDTDLLIVGEKDQLFEETDQVSGEQKRTGSGREHVEVGSEMTAGLDLADFDTLCIADSARLLKQLEESGAAFCAYAHSGNTIANTADNTNGNSSEDLSAAEYILMDLQWVDRDSLVKIWQRQRNIPWTILETERCVVREFVPEDLDAIYELYDEDAKRFLEPPSEDRKKERDILTSYIHRVYRLCGYGHWAVIFKETGELIGRMGFSFPSAAAPWHNAGDDQVPDAVFGYLVRRDYRGQGITREAGAAILTYGFEKLGFTSIGADAAVANTISDKILRTFSFIPVAEVQNQSYYILHETNWGRCPAREVSGHSE